MFDAVNVLNIPAGATMVGGYTSGLYPTLVRLEVLFPHAVRVSIAVDAAHDADVLDVERGDATPAQAPSWATRQRLRGAVPCVYCSSDTWPAVVAAFKAARLPLPLWWEAHYDGVAVLSPGSIAKQYATGRYDTSCVATWWPGVDIPAVPAPTKGTDDMARLFACIDPTSDPRQGTYSGSSAPRHIVSETELTLIVKHALVDNPTTPDLLTEAQIVDLIGPR